MRHEPQGYWRLLEGFQFYGIKKLCIIIMVMQIPAVGKTLLKRLNLESRSFRNSLFCHVSQCVIFFYAHF
jgi:hypothetical protein